MAESTNNTVDLSALTESMVNATVQGFDEETLQRLLNTEEGLGYLISCYSDYARAISIDRAIIGVDGFKPVHRRILYAMFKNKVYTNSKNGGVVGLVAPYHPHGEGSVYEALTRLVRDTLYQVFPLLDGKGSLGRVYSSSKPAPMRYTYSRLAKESEVCFRNMDGVRVGIIDDGEYPEPELLPVAIPMGIIMSSSGIAVGMASNIPSNNLAEVIDYTIDIAKNGTTEKRLIPDFANGSYILMKDKEIENYHRNGKARFTLRAKWVVNGKDIIFRELPYYSTYETLKKQIDKAIDAGLITGISSHTEATGLNVEGYKVTCTSKDVVEQVLARLLKYTHLEVSVRSNLTFIVNEQPVTVGTEGYVKHWLNFRTGVLRKSFQNELDAVREQIPKYEVLVDLLTHSYKWEEFTQTLARLSDNEAYAVLYKYYPNEPKSTFDWIMSKTIRSLSGVARKQETLENLRAREKELVNLLENVTDYIVSELQEIKRKYAQPRKTERTTVVYDVMDDNKAKVKVEAVPVVVTIEDKFIRKIKADRLAEDLKGIRCMSDDIISVIDSNGRVIRVFLDQIPFHTLRDRGLYLKNYIGEEDDDYQVVAVELIEDKTIGYLYSDGYASVVNYGEWVGLRTPKKVVPKGVSEYAGLIMHDFDFSKRFIYVITNTGRFGFFTNDFKHPKRVARTKLVPLKKGEHIAFACNVSDADLIQLVTSPSRYVGRLSNLLADDKFNEEYLNLITK